MRTHQVLNQKNIQYNWKTALLSSPTTIPSNTAMPLVKNTNYKRVLLV